MLSTFIKLPFVIKIFILSIFEWPFYTGFTVRVLPLTSKRLDCMDAQADQMAVHVSLILSCDSWGEALFGPRGII